MSNFVPIRKYNGDQVIINSGRLVFNSKDDNVFITAKKDLAISVEGSVHVNVGPSNGSSSNIYVVNSPKIQFGLNNTQPVPKGENLSNFNQQLLTALTSLATSLSSAIGIGVGTVTQPSINAAGAKLQGDIANLTDLMKDINSKITFTS